MIFVLKIIKFISRWHALITNDHGYAPLRGPIGWSWDTAYCGCEVRSGSGSSFHSGCIGRV